MNRAQRRLQAKLERRNKKKGKNFGVFNIPQNATAKITLDDGTEKKIDLGAVDQLNMEAINEKINEEANNIAQQKVNTEEVTKNA